MVSPTTPTAPPAAGRRPAPEPPPRTRTDQPAALVGDALGGDMAAVYALLEWLDGRGHEPLRRHQATVLRMAVGRLVGEALVVAAEPGHLGRSVRAAAARQEFARALVEAFGTDLYADDDVIRFVAATLWPAAG